MNHKILLLEFFLLLLKYSDSLILYQSTIPIQIEEVSGLHFVPGHLLKVYDHSLSACVRINYKRFKSYTGATILHFGDLNLARPFVNLAAGYPWTFPDLGLYLKEKGYDNWILRELPENYIVWTTNKWHHVCLSYSKVNSSVIVVKVQFSIFKTYRQFFFIKNLFCFRMERLPTSTWWMKDYVILKYQKTS